MSADNPLEDCRHCGKHHPGFEQRTSVEVKRSSTPIPPQAEIETRTLWVVWECKACALPTFQEIYWTDFDDDPAQATSKTFYPQPSLVQIGGLPPSVARPLAEAMKVKELAPNLFAVAIGRTLEAMCKHENVRGSGLTGKLTNLANSGRIPEVYARMATQLRDMRDLGAHANEVEVEPDDVPLLLDFAEGILSYLYVAPARADAMAERLNEVRRGRGFG
jgi:hypothetical protein